MTTNDTTPERVTATFRHVPRCEFIASGAPGGAPETTKTVSTIPLRYNAMGPQRFSRIQITDVSNFVAAGSSQADATLLRSAVNNVTGADGTKGVRMPPVVAPADHFRPPGTLVIVHNESSSNLKLYPHVGGSINGGAANAAITIPANTMRWLIALTSTNYGLMLT
jgi:6-phosphogluconolactonase (cycloisomerase 2 family)